MGKGAFKNYNEKDEIGEIKRGWGRHRSKQPKLKALRKKWTFEQRERDLNLKRRREQRENNNRDKQGDDERS